MKIKILLFAFAAFLTFNIDASAQSKKKTTKKSKDKNVVKTGDPIPGVDDNSKVIDKSNEKNDVKKDTVKIKQDNADVRIEKDTKETSNSTTSTTETKEVTPQEDVKKVEEVITKSEPVVTNSTNGAINWTEQYIEAKGESVIDNEKFKNPAQARAMATRGAIVVAQRNLLEIVKGVQITSETTVQDMVATSDFIYTRLDGMIKGAQQVGEAVEKNGLIEVRMRVPLYEKNGLAPVVFDNIPARRDAVQSSFDEQGQPKARGVANAEENVVEAADKSEQKVESANQFAFNFKGKKIDPSMFPVVVDEKNNILIDYSKLYDPTKGKFPKIIKTTDELIKSTGYNKNIKVLDVLSAQKGKIVIDNKSVKKVNWAKVGATAAKIGKFLLLLI